MAGYHAGAVPDPCRCAPRLSCQNEFDSLQKNGEMEQQCLQPSLACYFLGPRGLSCLQCTLRQIYVVYLSAIQSCATNQYRYAVLLLGRLHSLRTLYMSDHRADSLDVCTR